MDHDPVPEVRALVLEAQGHDPSAPIPASTAWDRLIEALEDAAAEVRGAHPELADGSMYAGIHAYEMFWLPHDPALDGIRTGASDPDGFDFASLDEMTRRSVPDLEADLRISLLVREAALKHGGARRALDELREGSSLIVPVIDHDDGWINVSAGTFFLAPRHIALYCAHEMRMALMDGDTEEAVAWFDRGLAMIQALQRVPTMTTGIMASTALSAFQMSAMILVTHPEFSEVHLRRLDGSLLRLDDRESILQRLERFAEIELRYWASRRFARSGIAVWREIAVDHGSVVEPRDKPPAITNLYGLVIPRRDTAMAALDEFGQAMERWERLPVSERPDSPDHPFEAADRVPAAFRFDSLSSFTPMLIHQRDDHVVLVAGFRAMLAIELFHRRNGRYPETLAELVPEFSAELPTNPIEPGEPFAYQRLESGSTLGVGYLIAARSRCGEVDGFQVWRSDDGSDDWIRRNAINLPPALRSGSVGAANDG
ncbi:MAG: hypothetical protein ACTS3F_13730 [Phycisphaerales bacterium]